LLFYLFAHGANVNINVCIFNVEAFIIYKYIDIVLVFFNFEGINYLISIFVHFIIYIYLRSWVNFWVFLVYLMFMLPSIGHIFDYPKPNKWVLFTTIIVNLQFIYFGSNLKHSMYVI
jgi:hypothetical protein